MILTDGFEEMANLFGGIGTAPLYIGIGTGSSTVTAGQSGLKTETDRNIITSFDNATPQEINYTADFTSTEMSGTTLWEFGLFTLSSGGICYQREVIGSIAFNGDSELQIQMTHRFN
jgi:hypothetical protein